MTRCSFRHELKYFIAPYRINVLRQRLRCLLRPDPHTGPAGCYRITSLYFDDLDDSAVFEKLSGVRDRQKIRVRIYGGSDEIMVLEKKVKRGDGILKERVRISRPLYEALRQGNPEPLLDTDSSLLHEVAWQITNRRLRPKVIVDYVREAYVYPVGNVRITFDQRLRSGLTNLDLFRQAPLIPVLEDGLAIMEVKYDAFLPGPVQALIQCGDLTRQAASKYVLCCAVAKSHAWEDTLV